MKVTNRTKESSEESAFVMRNGWRCACVCRCCFIVKKRLVGKCWCCFIVKKRLVGKNAVQHSIKLLLVVFSTVRFTLWISRYYQYRKLLLYNYFSRCSTTLDDGIKWIAASHSQLRLYCTWYSSEPHTPRPSHIMEVGCCSRFVILFRMDALTNIHGWIQ